MPGMDDLDSAQVLGRTFYDRDVTLVARELLGAVIIHDSDAGRTAGRIVETEAYLPAGDSACHGARGRTRRNASMFGPPGHAYVYAIHARWCLNTVTEEEGRGCAVLIRALEPLAGIALMQQRRGMEKVLDLARGPARLCEALGIDRELDGWDLTQGEVLWIAAAPADTPPVTPTDVVISPRVGVTSAQELPLRYFVADCRYVSKRRLRA